MQGQKLLIISLLCFGLLIAAVVDLQAQEQQPMRVAQTDEQGRAIRFDFNFTSQELKGVLEWLSRETDLTIIASENDIRDKQFSLINLRNVTIEEVIENIKTVLTQYDLTLIQTDSTLLVTTFERAMVTKGIVKNITPDPNLVEMTDEIQTYIIRLTNVVASELVDDFKPLLNKQAHINADERTNALVITDVSSNIRRIVTILQVADEGERFPLKILIYPLAFADANGVAQALTNIFREDGGRDERQSDSGATRMTAEEAKAAAEQMKADGTGYEVLDGTIRIIPETNSNSLIIKASEANLVFLQEIIKDLDVAPTAQTQIRTFRLQYAAAEDVAQTLQEVLTGESGGDRRRMDAWDRAKLRNWQREQGLDQEGIVGTINVSHNERLNIIVVSSDPRNFSIIEKIIQELDQEQTQEEIRLYFLKHADAETLVPSLQDLFEGGSAGRDRERPWWERRYREPSEGGGGFGVQGEVHLVADIRLNAVLISTSSQNFETIDSLIERLDVNMPDQEWGTRMYRLQYADAQNIAAVINNTYQGSPGSSRDFFYYLPRSSLRNQTQGSLAGNVTAEAYPTLNAVIISTATQRNFQLIEDFIKSMDIPTPENLKEVTVAIRLEYADAETLEDVLEDVWEGDDNGGFSSFRFFVMNAGRQQQQDINSLRGKVTVFAESDTNTLIVTTLQRYLPDVKALIKELDFVRGQVWIDIQILEVTLDETTKLGIELTAQENKLFGVSPVPGNPLIGSLEGQLGLEQEISGFNLGLATKEYMALLHTLMRENKVQTLSTPSLLTRDARSATWSSGRRIPYLQSVDTTSILGEAVSQPLFNYDFIDPPVGINIDLTPYIAKSKAGEDGKRTIGLDINNISASNFIEFTDFNAPITDDNSISVYIDVEDGQQIVVGGIIRKKQKQVENKLPILGDIPLLGRLFKSTETAIEDAEIVIIITPHIVDIKNPDDLEKLKEKADNWQSNGTLEMEKTQKETDK
jgi:type II secretory pathway component GspD/PulD (secretin)